MKMKKLLFYVIACSIIATLFVQASVMCGAASLTEPAITSADFNDDGAVNMLDVVILASAFNSNSGDSRYLVKLDINQDGAINMKDVVFIAKYFGRIVEKPTSTQMPTPTSVPSVIDTGNYTFDEASGTILKYNGLGGDIVIPDTINGVKVTAIGDMAFGDTGYSITGVTIPDGVTSLGNCAFHECAITDVTIPKSVTSMGPAVFMECPLKNVTFLGNEPSFSNFIPFWEIYNENFKITVMPDSKGFGKPEPYNNETNWNWNLVVPTIGNVTLMVRLYDSSVVEKGDYVFSAKTGTIIKYKGNGGDVAIPSIIDGVKVTCIGDDAFAGCKELTSISIPQGVTEICYGAFTDCTELKSVTMPKGITKIGAHAFQSCSNLTDIVIPNGVTSIERYTFLGCWKLANITLPESLTDIGKYAFSYCNSLSEIKIPKGLTSIGEHAFYYCIILTSISIPDSVTSIGKSAFGNCEKLTNITIPSGVVSIGNYAFGYCKELSNASFLGDQPQNLGWSIFIQAKVDFKITVSSTAKGFGKPEPYNNETNWIWDLSPNNNDAYTVFLDSAYYDFDESTGTI